MRIIRTTSDFKKKGCVLTIGNFDGVHLGHREILSAAGQTAEQRGTEPVVMTFEPHPVAILHPEKAPGVLTPLKLKTHLLAKYGADCLIVLENSFKLLNLSPTDFVDRFLVKNIQPGVVVEGENFNFGYHRTGNVHTLQRLGAEKGFEVSIIGAKEVKLSAGQIANVSSTMIRNMLVSGRVADAAVALGRPYRLIGQVVPGCGKGKQLGFPTANIVPGGQIIPAEGVYAGLVEVGENYEQACQSMQRLQVALSISRSESFGSDTPLMIEAHLLMESVGQLYGKWLAMDFVKRIRDQRRFGTEKELSNQIAKDCEKAKEILTTKGMYLINPC